MNNTELNEYIKHYIEKDKTGRAIMLTGPWGSGKSFYIKNNLVTYLAKQENKYDVIIVSLYGLVDLADISRALFFEVKFRKVKTKFTGFLAKKLGLPLLAA